MSGMGPRGSKAPKLDAAESSRGRERLVHEHRLVRKSPPPGLIFMCNSKTKRDCYIYKVLGLPLAKKDLVEQIIPGMFLFLFDIDLREMHGIFEASSHGGVNLEPNAFQGQGSYPAQVRFSIYRECLPLPEQVFKMVIQENYYARNKFHHELTSDQVSKLMQLFHPVEAPRKRLLVDSTTAALHDAGGSKLNLLGRTPPKLADRMPQYSLPASGIRLEERLPRRDLSLSVDAHPLVADSVGRRPVPQTGVLDGRLEQKDLLTRGPLEEVDQLALKYLQPGDPGAGRALNPRHQTTAIEAPRAGVSSLQQEAIFRSQVLEVERLRRAAVEQARLREYGSSLPGAMSGLGAAPFAAAHARADIRRRR